LQRRRRTGENLVHTQLLAMDKETDDLNRNDTTY